MKRARVKMNLGRLVGERRRQLRAAARVFAFVFFLFYAAVGWAQFAGGPVAKPLVTPRQKAALIKLSGPVDDVMLTSLKRRVDLARKQNCDLIIYEMDTYGGLLTSALDISRFTKN